MPKRLRNRQWDEQLSWGRWAPRTTGRNRKSRAGSWATVRTFVSSPDVAMSGEDTEEVGGVIPASGLFLKNKVGLGKPRTLNQRKWRPLNSLHVYLPFYHVFHKHVGTQLLTHFQMDSPVESLHLKMFNFDVFFRVQWGQMKDALRDVTTGAPQTPWDWGPEPPVWRWRPPSQLLPALAVLPSQCYRSPCSLLSVIGRLCFHKPLSFLNRYNLFTILFTLFRCTMQQLLLYSQSCTTVCLVHSAPKEALHHWLPFSIPSQALRPRVYLLSLWICLFWIFLTNGIIWRVVFSVCLFSCAQYFQGLPTLQQASVVHSFYDWIASNYKDTPHSSTYHH